MIALRGVALGADETHEVVARPAYDDTGILLVPGVSPFVFPMSTHPFQTHSKLSTDADGDGLGDVATIRPGLYVARLALRKPFPIWTVETADGRTRIPCTRDLNHDGRTSEDEASRQLTATAILIHTGYDAPKESEHRSSIGCQTASLRSLQTLAAAGPVIDYHLVLAEEALRLLGDGESEPPLENIA